MDTAQVSPQLRERLYEDTWYWAWKCAKIVDRQGKLVALEANGPQLRLEATMEAQRKAGKPIRIIILKARKLGASTWVEAKIMHRITQRAYRRALVVAQDNDTAGELFDISDRIWANLPPDKELNLKPPRTHSASSKGGAKYMKFGEPSALLRNQGIVGLDSSLEVGTAREVQAGRGFTISELHGSEVAFWPDVRKLTALLNAVPDEPDTMVVLESTANGLNHFHERWQAAENGESEYATVFAGWTEDPAYQLGFFDDEARAEFVAQIGEGPWGEEEPDLVEMFGCTPEQLHWRRKTIVDKCDSKLEVFHTEYPVSADQAFVTSGKHVFSMVLVSRMTKQVEHSDPALVSPDNPGPQIGTLVPKDVKVRKIRSGSLEVPRAAGWAPKEPGKPALWRVWELPDPGEDEKAPGAYIVAADPSGGEENEKGESAYHAIQVIDHRTKAQVAEYRSRIDPDLIAEQMLLAALLYNKALIVAETTGGYGGFMVRRIRRDYGYPLVYRRRALGKDRDRQEDKLGWDTNVSTKNFLESRAMELLRDGYGDEAPDSCEFVRSRLLAREFTTYIRDERGRTGPQPNAFSDLLMAWMIGQTIAHERPVPFEHRSTSTQTRRRRVKDPITAW